MCQHNIYRLPSISNLKSLFGWSLLVLSIDFIYFNNLCNDKQLIIFVCVWIIEAVANLNYIKSDFRYCGTYIILGECLFITRVTLQTRWSIAALCKRDFVINIFNTLNYYIVHRYMFYHLWPMKFVTLFLCNEDKCVNKFLFNVIT